MSDAIQTVREALAVGVNVGRGRSWAGAQKAYDEGSAALSLIEEVVKAAQNVDASSTLLPHYSRSFLADLHRALSNLDKES